MQSESVQSTPTKAPMPTPKKKYSRQDWLSAGFQTLAKKGHSGLSVEPIARSLGVSKGSFYHHFKDLPEYKDALLNQWQDKATTELIRATQATNFDPLSKLQATVERSIETYDHYDGPNIEPAIRNWARHDTTAYKHQIEVDIRRLVYVQDLFAALGFSTSQAETRASLLYGALIGLETLSADGAIRDAKPLRFLVNKLAEE